MEKANSDLLPHILESLSEKKEFCDTYENLCNEIKFVLSDANLQNHDIEESIESALSVGQNLGILTWTDELIRMPFNYNKKTTKRPSTAKKGIENAALLPAVEQMLMTQPRRIRDDIPDIRESGRRSRRSIRRRSPRRNSRRRLMSRRRRMPRRRLMSRRRSLSRRR